MRLPIRFFGGASVESAAEIKLTALAVLAMLLVDELWEWAHFLTLVSWDLAVVAARRRDFCDEALAGFGADAEELELEEGLAARA